MKEIQCDVTAGCIGLRGHTGPCRIVSGVATVGDRVAVKVVDEVWKCGDCDKPIDPTKMHDHVCPKASTLPAPPNTHDCTDHTFTNLTGVEVCSVCFRRVGDIPWIWGHPDDPSSTWDTDTRNWRKARNGTL